MQKVTRKTPRARAPPSLFEAGWKRDDSVAASSPPTSGRVTFVRSEQSFALFAQALKTRVVVPRAAAVAAGCSAPRRRIGGRRRRGNSWRALARWVAGGRQPQRRSARGRERESRAGKERTSRRHTVCCCCDRWRPGVRESAFRARELRERVRNERRQRNARRAVGRVGGGVLFTSTRACSPSSSASYAVRSSLRARARDDNEEHVTCR